MCHADGVGVQVLHQLVEISVAQVPCRQFDALLVEGGILPRVEMDAVDGYVESMAEVYAERLVPVRLFAAQVEVAMTSLHLVAHLVEQEQQTYAVCPSRQGHEVLAVFLEQVVTADVSAYRVL